MISREEVIRIATELHEEGYGKSEAYPIQRWKNLGYPEDIVIFRAIDAYIRFLREMGKVGCMTTTSTGS